MKYKKIMLLICLTMCILFSMSGVFANEVGIINETIGETDLGFQELQINSDDAMIAQQDANNLSSISEVYFDVSASEDGDGSQSHPYKVYKSDRISYGATAHFADGVYDMSESLSILGDKITFIGQSKENTRLVFPSNNKFDFTINPNAYFVLKDLTLQNVHIKNQANLVADNVNFGYSVGFNPNSNPDLSYSTINKMYNSTCGGVIICDTPSGTVTTLDLTGCSFVSNSATSGGAIATYNSIANIKDCFFYNSYATRFGGAIYAESSNINIYNSYFELNRAKYGGVMYVDNSNVYLENSIFNLSQAYSFGGVIAASSSKLDVNHTLFEDFASLNDAGGAIYSLTGTLNVIDSTFREGYSNFGGAICNLRTNSSIVDVEFINNDATYYGGSIYNMYGNIVIADSKFINSHANYSGGSIFNRISDSFSLINNRFVDSTADEGPIVFIDGDKVNVVENGNAYDNSYVFLQYGNIYDIDYYQSVPLINYSAQSPDVLPSYYDSRKYGYVTPAKDQIQGGNCWAFAGIATLEACIKKATGIAYDFSEENVKNLMSEYSLFGSDSEINTGGNLYMFIAYLAGWFGPTYDAYDVYDDFSSLSVIYDSIIHVQNVYILPERQDAFDNDYIKRAVMEHGAVSIGIDLSENEGHAVTIVGWDDEFSSNDFLDNKAVGAWIIKNSWGTNWGYDGFGYLSYQQPISFGYTFIFNDDRGYSDVYQYDFAGKSGFYSLNTDEAYVKNKFIAKNDEILSAFSTYFDEPTDFTASIYLNGELVTTQSGYSEIGYYTIPLNNEVLLTKGDTFEVEIKFFNGAPVYIPLCTANEINKITFDKDISFYSTDGVHWHDLYTESNLQGVACIKAFTRLKELTEISIDLDQFVADNQFDNVGVDDLINIQLNLPQYYDVDGIRHSLEGMVTFLINDQYYYANVNDGNACLNISFDKDGTYEVVAQYQSNRMISNLVNFTLHVLKTDESTISIQTDDVSKFYGGPEKYVATLTKEGEVLDGVNVKISVDGKNYTVKTDSNGQVILDLNLSVGVYDVHLQYGGKVVSSKFTVLTTISVNDVTRDFLDSYVSASFLNIDGNALSNKEVIFEVKYYPQPFKPITDHVGLATVNLPFYVGKYSVSATNPINGEKKEFTLEIVQIDSECVLSITQSHSVVSINAAVNPSHASGYVTFLLLGNVYKVDIIRGVATLKLDHLPVGDYNVTAIYSSDDNFRVSSSSKTFSVTDNPYQLSSGNYYSYYGASGTMAKLTDENGNGVKGEVVYATILNNTYNATTDEDGIATFNLDLEVGNYTVLFEYNGQSLVQYVFIYSTIDVVESSGEYLNSKVGAYFHTPYYNDQDSGLDVKFVINGKEYATTTDINGYASADIDDLEVGIHTVTIINVVSGEQKQSKVTIYKTTPTITLTKTQHKNSLVLTASLAQSSAIGNIVFTMGSKKYTCRVMNGKAILAFNDFDQGSYNAYANYIGDANFNNILSSTMDFDFVPSDYALSAPPQVSKYYGGSEKVTVNLTNYGNPVSGAVVTLLFDGETYELTTDSNGMASFGPRLDPDVYSLQFSYDDLTVSSKLTVKTTIKDVTANSKASAIIYDTDGDVVKNKRVTFKIDGKEYYANTNDDGLVTLDVNLDLGNYKVTIVNPVSGESIDSTLTITRTTPNLSLSVDGDVLEAVLPKAATGQISFIFDDGSQYDPEIINGVAKVEDLEPGEYNVNVIYYGDDSYNRVSNSLKFEVNLIQLATSLSAQKVTTTYGTSKNIVVTLKDSNDNPLAEKTVIVKLNNKIYTATTKSNGQAVISIPNSLPVKNYYVATLIYEGDDNYLQSTSSVNVVVNKATPKLTAAKKTFKMKDKTKKYIVTLKTDKNKVYKNQKITIKVNGKTYSAKTNSKGKATFKLTKLTKKGTFTATVKYAGNSYYKTVTKKIKITVKK